LAILTTHTLANVDGNWSPSNRFHRVQQGQLAALARIVRATSGPLVLCGDFNVAHGSVIYNEFIANAGLIDTFAGGCPPTFHADYLGPGQVAHCIDFILVTTAIRTVRADVVFAGKQPLSRGPAYLSDHVGLRAVLDVLAPVNAPDCLSTDPDCGPSGA
jgi:endonuclease/exonuclease/phosphatase family metal-dependent hydrolase